MKKIGLSITLFLLFFCFIKFGLFAEESDTNIGYKLYEERVNNICEQYQPSKKIFLTDDYIEIISDSSREEVEEYKDKWDNKGGTLEEAGSDVSSSATDYGKAIANTPKSLYNTAKKSFTEIPLNLAKSTYKENMNNIYKCMVLNSQISSLNLIKNDLINNNPNLKKNIEQKIKDKIEKIESNFKKMKCKNLGEKNNSIQKTKLLKQTTYELCKYHSYLEYLREYNSNLANIELPENGSINSIDLIKSEQTRINEIDDEIAHIYKVYPIAFSAYKQYEDNLTIHLLLELIKEDYIALREGLHETLNPINQVVYKIANAMKK